MYPPEVITPLDGLRAAAGAMEIVHDAGKDLVRARQLAGEADAVLVVAGYTHRDEGEFIPGQGVDLAGDARQSIGGDRLDLTLGKTQEELILAAAGANANVTVAIMSGSAVLMERWRERVPGILMIWYPGMQGGAALADVLLGRVNPSGRLPFSVPTDAGDLPDFDREAAEISYDLWHGYTKLDRDGVEPAFPFGFGLSYTEYLYSEPSVEVDDANEALLVHVDAVNAGDLTGETVLQVYAGLAEPVPDQPIRRLCGFARVELPPRLKQSVALRVPLRELACFEPESGHWVLPGAEWRIWAGGSSAEADLRATTVSLSERSWSS